MLHSKVGMFSSAQAERTMFTARTSSEVSITTIGVEELIKTFRRSRPSLIRAVLRNGFELGSTSVRLTRKRAERAIVASQTTRRFARLAQIPRCAKNAYSELQSD